MSKKNNKHKHKDKDRNLAQKELIEYYGGKSVPHKSKKDYKRKEKHKKDLKYIDID